MRRPADGTGRSSWEFRCFPKVMEDYSPSGSSEVGEDTLVQN